MMSVKLADHYWHTQQGSYTPDNRDDYGMIKVQGTTVHILTDGATNGPNSGELARAIVTQLQQRLKNLKQPPSAGTVIDTLKLIHTDLRRKHPADSASYIIALQDKNNSVTTLHAGDCRLGKVDRHGEIHWITAVHSLANATCHLDEHELRPHPDRHLLTRSFRGRRFLEPECNTFDIQAEEEFLLLASDGFWANLSIEDQQLVLSGKQVNRKTPYDDMSCLKWPCSECHCRATHGVEVETNCEQSPQQLIPDY